MLSDLKNALIYPVSDPTWPKKIAWWWLYYCLFVTSPALLGHYLSTIRQSFEDPEEDAIPTFDGFGKLFVSGIGLFFGMFCLQMIPALPNFLALAYQLESLQTGESPGPGIFICFAVHMAIMAASFLLWPALCLQYVEFGRWSALLRLKDLLRKMTWQPGKYLLLVAYPFLAWLAIVLTSFTVIGMILVIPAFPVMVMAHARMLGLYLREHHSKRTNTFQDQGDHLPKRL